MRTASNWAGAGAFLGLAVSLVFAPGCGRKPVSARTQPPHVTKWKHHPPHERGIPKGIVVEQLGRDIRARYCDLKPGDGFIEHSTVAHGIYLPERKAIIFPLGMPDTANAEEWMQAGGPHLTVPFDAQTARLTADLASTTDRHSIHFVRHRE